MRFAVIMAMGLISVSLAGGGAADTGTAANVYNVSNVEVEARASSAVRARQVAILEGHAEALLRLLKRLTLPEDWPRLPVLSGKDAQLLSTGYATDEEKNSATNYIGRISVRFTPDKVRSLLRQNNIPFGDVPISPALVIPVYDLPNGRRVLWESDNIWRAAWSRSDIGESLTPFILPVGDIEDIVALPTRAARLENRAALLRIAQRYDAQRVLLARAGLVSVTAGGRKGYALGVTLDVIAPGDGAADESIEFSLAGSNDPEELIKRGVKNVLRMTGIVWKRRVIVHHDESGEREVMVNFDSLVEWRHLRKKMSQVPVLKSYQVRRIDDHSALLTINYSGSRAILALALAQQDIELVFSEEGEGFFGEDDQWRMRLRK